MALAALKVSLLLKYLDWLHQKCFGAPRRYKIHKEIPLIGMSYMDKFFVESFLVGFGSWPNVGQF